MSESDKTHSVNSDSQLRKAERKQMRLLRALAFAKEKYAYRHICACCRKAAQNVVSDHNHHTGVKRGYICPACNNLLGYIEWIHDHPLELARGISYLEQFDPKQAVRLTKIYARR